MLPWCVDWHVECGGHYDWLFEVGLLKEVAGDQLRRHARERLGCELYVSILESGDIVMLGVVIRSLEDAFVETGVVNGRVDSD